MEVNAFNLFAVTNGKGGMMEAMEAGVGCNYLGDGAVKKRMYMYI